MYALVQAVYAFQAALQHLEQCFAQWFVRNSTARRGSCCKAREALRVEILGHAAEQIGRKRIERGRFFSLSVHYHVFGTGAARELGVAREGLGLVALVDRCVEEIEADPPCA